MVESWLRDLGTRRWAWVKTFGDINPTLLAIDLELARGNHSAAAAQARTVAANAASLRRWSEYVPASVRLALLEDLEGNSMQADEALREAARVGIPGGFSRQPPHPT
jgi:hypothetical protein